MGKGGVDTMPQNRRHKRTILIKCKHCDKITNMDWEETTADEFNDTMVSNLDRKGTIAAVSQQNGSILHHKITEALNRLKKEFGYGEKCKK